MNVDVQGTQTLAFHLQEVLQGSRRFENVAQAVSRMILGDKVEKITRGGQATYDFSFFRQGAKHPIGWFDEINDLTNFVADAAEGGDSKTMAFVFVGEPGNGKTFFVDYLCAQYRRFLALAANRRYTFDFVNLGALGQYGKIEVIQSQTFEDPIILAMNLCESLDESKEFLARAGFDDQTLERLYRNYRPLGASTEYILGDIRAHCDGDIEKMLGFVRIIPARITQGTVTTKYPAGDKITSSAVDLVGEDDLLRAMDIKDSANPYRTDVRVGALARVAGGGIHFADELFKNKIDLVQIYLGVIQDRIISVRGYSWPIDALVIATSNNDEYNRFVSEKEQSPIKDRCHVCFVAHNTDYKLQQQLVRYALGSAKKLSVMGEEIHEDPNLELALAVALTLTRLPHAEKLSPIEMMKLEAGEVAGEKGVKTLTEIKTALNKSQDVTKRWGQTGVGHRGLGRIIQIMRAMAKTHEGKCFFALDCFEAVEREILDHVAEAVDRDKFIKDLQFARQLYRKQIKASIFNAFREDPDAIRTDVMAYVNMIIGIDSDALGPDKIWRFRDPQTGEFKTIKVDERYVNSVEARMGRKDKEQVETFRTSIRKIYGQKVATDPSYDFMDNEQLVKAVTDVKLESDVAGASSLVGALANRINEENRRIYNRMVRMMLDQLGYCTTCAEKTIEYFCEKKDES